ncbi:MAG: hypothetical protein HOP31_07355 [Ignavibacteria bacterium]|nr:hypothetical protein [Ignavibacteria bacterium]
MYKRKLQRKVHPAGKSNCSNIKAIVEEFVNSLALRHTNSVIIALMFSPFRLIFPNGIEKLLIFSFSPGVPKGGEYARHERL